MTRAEHIAWCKQRALEYLELGQLPQAVGSMASDMMKHEGTADSMQTMAVIGMSAAMNGDADEVRRWIEGF